MNIIGICASAVVASVLAVMLKKHNAEYSLILTVCSAVLIFGCIISELVVVITSVEDIFVASRIDAKFIEILLKCVGICFLTEFTCDCCKDASQAALSSAVLIAGRLCVLITALPLFEEFLDFSLKLSGGRI